MPPDPVAAEVARFAFLSDVLAAEKDADKTAALVKTLGSKFDRAEIARIQDVFAEYNDFDINDAPYR